jgi:biopolymer transport protein TolR
MAGGMDLGTSSKGGKKALDSALNLVPFIDLMAVLIVFLIMSAVWTQLNRLQVSQAGSDAQTPVIPTVSLRVRVTETSLQVSADSAQQPVLNVTRDERGRLATDTLTGQLAELKRAFPDTTTITIEPEDAVKYEDLIRVIDAATPSFPSVSVSPAS